MNKWLVFPVISVFIIIIAVIPILGQDKEQESFGIDVSHHNGKINWEQVPDVDIPKNIPQIGLFDFRSFLNIL